MDLKIERQQVTRLDLGYTLVLATDSGYEIQIESEFTLAIQHATHTYSPDPSNVDSVELARLAVETVRTVAVDGEGTLTVSFDGGARLQVAADTDFEAWTIAGPNGLKVVCMPGGELATWNVDHE